MNVLSLFSGIGGLELGLERAGMTVVGQVELDPFCRSVLAAHWPEVPRHDDVRTAVDWWRGERRPAVHVVAGGFPCQPVSLAGLAKLAQDDARWLWPEMAAVIADVRPRWVIAENVPGLLRRGFGDVLRDLAALGYDAEWDCIPASAVGAPHRRDRVLLVAYPNGPNGGRPTSGIEPENVRDALAIRAAKPGRRTGVVAGAVTEGWATPRVFGSTPGRVTWPAEPRVGRMAHGVPAQVDRLRSLGNAVVPQVAEHIGRLIVSADRLAVAA